MTEDSGTEDTNIVYDTSNYDISNWSSQEEQWDKITEYDNNICGEVIRKKETSTKPGLIHFGTGSKGEIKAKNVDIRNIGIIELKQLVQKVAYLQTLMSKAKEKYSDMDLEELETQWDEQVE